MLRSLTPPLSPLLVCLPVVVNHGNVMATISYLNGYAKVVSVFYFRNHQLNPQLDLEKMHHMTIM